MWFTTEIRQQRWEPYQLPFAYRENTLALAYAVRSPQSSSYAQLQFV